MVENQKTLYQDKVAELKERFGVKHLLGLIGSSNYQRLDSDAELVTNAIFLIEKKFRKVAIVSGGTRGGVPEFAFHLARSIGRPIIGVSPENGQKYSLPNLDL